MNKYLTNRMGILYGAIATAIGISFVLAPTPSKDFSGELEHMGQKYRVGVTVPGHHYFVEKDILEKEKLVVVGVEPSDTNNTFIRVESRDGSTDGKRARRLVIIYKGRDGKRTDIKSLHPTLYCETGGFSIPESEYRSACGRIDAKNSYEEFPRRPLKDLKPEELERIVIASDIVDKGIVSLTTPTNK